MSDARASYRPEIDGLRAFAVLPVILYHADATWMPGGFIGVDVFFVISGYLITRLILAERSAGTFSLARFYERRARRILPALIVVLAASLPFAWALMLPRELWAFGESVLAALGFVANLFFWNQSGYFAPDSSLVPLLHTWSLAVEEQFYLLYPLLVALVWRTGSLGLGILLSGLAVGSMGFVLWVLPDSPDTAFYLLPGRVWELASGALAALALARRPALGALPIGPWLAVVGLTAIIASALFLDAASGVPGPAALLPVGGTLLVILFAHRGPARRLLGCAPLIAIGLISYSAYLWHHPILAFARLHWLGEPPLWALAGALVLTFWLAALTWAFVEQPFRTRTRIAARPALAWGLAGTATVGATAAWIVFAQPTGGHLTPEIAMANRELAALRRERRNLIGFGRCQFARERTVSPLPDFLAAWDCTGPTQSPAPLVVVGDSHAADTAAALRAVGHAVTQMTGAGCDLSPLTMHPDCRALFDALKDRLRALDRPVRVLLANRWRKVELTDAALTEMVAYWQELPGEVIFLTSRPTWNRFAMKTVRGEPRPGPGPFARPCIAPDLRFSAKSEHPDVRARLEAAGLTIKSTGALLLPAIGACGPWGDDGQPLLVDDGHLTAGGARLYGDLLSKALGLDAGRAHRAPIGPRD